jgi:chromosome segregation ATPase
MAVALMAAGLGLAGCGEEMARMEQTQSRLLAMVGANADQIAIVAARIEQNQEALQAELEDLRGNIRQVAAETAAVGREQLKLHEAMQNNSEQLASEMAAIEQSCGLLAENQHELRAGIESVQANTRTVVAQAASRIASDIATVADEQTRLHETVQAHSQQLADDVAVIDQSLGLLTENQQMWQSRTEGLEESIQQVAITIDALGEDLARVQETLQQNVRELASMMEVTGRDQLKFREKTQAGLQALDDSLSVLKQNQNRLQNQIEDVQNSTESMGRDVPEALVRLADELARLDIIERADIMDIEPQSSSPPSDSGGEQ